MKRIAAAVLILLSIDCHAQKSDAELLRAADFSDSLHVEKEPVLLRQIKGRCCYEPANHVFLGEAVRRFGLLPGLVVTTDRITRSTRIGRTGRHFAEGRTTIDEGVEAYVPQRRRKRK